MRRGLMIGLFLILVFTSSFVSAFSVDEYSFTSDFNCADFGLECGTTSGPLFKNCGFCSPSEYCYFGKCIEISAFGSCERPESLDTNCETALSLSDFYAFPGQPLSQRLEDYERVCENYGCTYNSETKKCTGIIPPCSYFMNRYCTQNDNEEKQSVLNEQTGTCTTTHKNFPKVNCDLRDGQWNEAEQSCTYISDLTCLARDDKWGSYYCRLRNVEEYTPKFIINRDSALPVIRDDGANMIWLNNNDLENIKNGGAITVNIKLENSGLPPNKPVTISATSGWEENKVYIQQEQILTDAEGSISTKLMISNVLLTALNYKGFSTINIPIDSVNGVSMNGRGDGFLIMTTTGECLGTARTCSSYSEEECLEIARFKLGTCNWDYETSSCKGGEGVSCDNFYMKEGCKIVGCSWKANNIFERFIDWIKGIFGG